MLLFTVDLKKTFCLWEFLSGLPSLVDLQKVFCPQLTKMSRKTFFVLWKTSRRYSHRMPPEGLLSITYPKKALCLLEVFNRSSAPRRPWKFFCKQLTKEVSRKTYSLQKLSGMSSVGVRLLTCFLSMEDLQIAFWKVFCQLKTFNRFSVHCRSQIVLLNT